MKTLSYGAGIIGAGIIASGIAVSAQAQEGKKSIPPCPTITTKYANDIAGVLGKEKEKKLEIFLTQLDKDHHHQLVYYSIEKVSDYGFATIEEFANAIGRQCKVGHPGVNTGVVLVTTKEPRRYRIETADTQKYLTDGITRLMIENSKEKCDINDFACRVPHITEAIEKVIAEAVKSEYGGVDKLRELTQKFQAEKSSESLSEILSMLGLGLILIFGVWGCLAIIRKDKKEEKEADEKLAQELKKQREYRASSKPTPSAPPSRTYVAPVIIGNSIHSSNSNDEDRKRKEAEAERRRRQERDEEDRRRRQRDDDSRRRSDDSPSIYDSGNRSSGGGSSGYSSGDSGGYSSGGGGGFDGGGSSGD